MRRLTWAPAPHGVISNWVPVLHGMKSGARQGGRLCLVAGALLTPGAAWADATYTVDKVTITGSKSVPTEKLLAVVQEHKGSKVSQADIVADQEAIMKVLGDANVVGGIQTSMVNKPGKHVEVVFAVRDEGVQAPTVTKIAPKLHAQIFDGNKSVPTDKLMAATGISPGEDMTNAKVAAAEQAIGDTYKAAKLPVSMSLSGETRALPGGKVDVLWHIVETKGAAKKPSKSRDADEQLN